MSVTPRKPRKLKSASHVVNISKGLKKMPAGSKVVPAEGAAGSATALREVRSALTMMIPNAEEDVNFVPLFNTQSELAEWVPTAINKRICTKFTCKKKDSDPLCACGHPQSKHSTKARNAYVKEETEWKVNLHTEPKPTDAFGEVEFVSYGGKVSKYVRADYNTDMDTMLTLMMDFWKLGRPNLLISVTGGAKNFHMRPRLKEVFRRGLMKAAESTGAWIITGGMHAGVMRHVGEAVRDYTVAHGNKKKIVAIGIATWGCVRHKDALVDPKGCWPAEYRHDSTNVRKQSPLDPNHSHFILVDNGTQHQFAVEIPFRASLESKIANMKTDSRDENSVSVPIVCVALEGGPGTLETVKSAIQSGTPAVIVEGSGRAADVLAFAYANSTEEEVEVTDKFGKKHKKVVAIVDNEVWDGVRKMIMDEWGDRDLDRRVNWVKECLQKRDHMTVFRLDGADTVRDIDLAILQALLKVNRDKSVDQLKLALAWNRIDVAKSEIFTDDTKWAEGELDEVMYMALINDRVDFVKLFMENGVSLRDFLDLTRMLQLYNGIPQNSILYQLLEKKRDKRSKYFSYQEVGQVIQELMGDFYRPLYLRDNRYRDLIAEEFLEDEDDEEFGSRESMDDTTGAAELGASALKSIPHQVYIDSKTGEQFAIVDFDEPTRDLFIWAVLLNRLDMAKLFWEEGKDGIAAALTAQRLLRSMLGNTEDTELQKELKLQAEYFEHLAVSVLSDCYATDEKKSQLLLVRELPGFGNATNILLAVEADNKLFIAHAACQSLFNNIWMGRLSHDNGLLRMWTCILCPVLIFLLIKYREDDRQQLLQETPSTQRGSQRKGKKSEAIELETMTNSGMGALSRKTSREKLVTLESQRSHKTDSPSESPGSHDNISWLGKVIYFYNAPVITFIHSCIFYVLFLVLYSVILLTAYNVSLSNLDILLIVWVITLFSEEVRQVLADESSQLRLKFRSYISDVWNVLDTCTLLFFIVGIVLRLIPDCSSCFKASRIILALNLMTFFFRILHIFSVHKELGPKLVMIGRMMVDLAFFTIILMTFIIAYGLASQAILFPNQDLDFTLAKDVVRRAYWQMYGELFLEEIEGDADCSNDAAVYSTGNVTRCPDDVGKEVVPILLGVYILITNVLMLNLLIAMFSYTFSMVQDHTDLHWNFQRYSLIKEYHDRPPLPPPLILLSHIYMAFWSLFHQCCQLPSIGTNSFRMSFNEMEEKQLILWENMIADENMRRSEAAEKQQIDNRVRDTSDRVDLIARKVDEMAESNFMMQSASSTVQPKLPPVLDDRINYLEEQMRRTAKALDWIINSMVEKGQGTKQGPPKLPDVDQLREDARRRRDEEADRKRVEFEKTLERQLELHMKARTSQYPCSSCRQLVYRFNVPDERVPWDVEWPEYAPTRFTDPSIVAKPWYADIDLLDREPVARPEIPFNSVDERLNVDRRSYLGEYRVVEGLPLNPQGRTGLYGRGVLGRWGPNHAGDPVVTRWQRDDKGEIEMDSGKPVLEFVSIQREDNKEWAIPGGIIENGQPVHSVLKAEFSEEALGSLMEDETKKKEIQEKLDNVFLSGTERVTSIKLNFQVYKGYVDDHRNTDNAWIETLAMNYHDDDGHILRNFQLRAGENVESVRWQRISSRQALYAAHLMILQKVAARHNAAF